MVVVGGLRIVGVDSAAISTIVAAGANGNEDSTNCTWREVYILPDCLSKHRYALFVSEYPMNVHDVEHFSSL